MILRTRIALVLLSMAVIGLEITLMRILAVRFWSHFAAMVISVALLGFGGSGTVLALVQSRLQGRHRFLLSCIAFCAALSIPAAFLVLQHIPLDIHYLAWDLPSEMGHILAMEALIALVFFLLGGFVGLALMDRPEYVHGHYGASLAGSAVGALLSVVLLYALDPMGLLILWAVLCYCGGALLVARRPRAVAAALASGALLGVLLSLLPEEVALSDYKKLALERAKPGVEVVHTEQSPLGRLDVVTGEAIHDAPPGMSLINPHPIPPRSLVIGDGDATYISYHGATLEDYRFLDYTTTALPFALGRHDNVLVIGSGGGAPVALARLHGTTKVIALEQNRRLVERISKLQGEREKTVYGAAGTEIHHSLARSHLRRSEAAFDLVLIPLLDPAGAGAAGLQSAQENFLFTREAFIDYFDHTTETGMVSGTVFARSPPRDGLRLFHLAVDVLRQRGKDPGAHLALIRSWETVTLLATKEVMTSAQARMIRSFCDERGFDIAYLPDVDMSEVNRYHRLARPYYALGARQLLSPEADAYVDSYIYRLGVPTDDRPYFDNFMRWSRWHQLRKQLKGRMPAFMELGSLFLGAALLQGVILAVALMVLPLTLQALCRPRSAKRGSKTVLAYFVFLGGGFMLLEMGFLQRIVLYLGHPIYSAATVIAGFLLFGGVGSMMSVRWGDRSPRAIIVAGSCVAAIALLYLGFLDIWLGWSQGWPLQARCLVVLITIALPAFAMGHMFPLGLCLIGGSHPTLVPLAWAGNGFASVLATAGAPLLAMEAGFSSLLLLSAACYLGAALFSPFLAVQVGLSGEKGSCLPTQLS